jgi:hypothetical protein
MLPASKYIWWGIRHKAQPLGPALVDNVQGCNAIGIAADAHCRHMPNAAHACWLFQEAVGTYMSLFYKNLYRSTLTADSNVSR